MNPILQMIKINKSFGTVRVLQDVNFDLLPGEVHAIVGENGAGKSTLIKILGGIYSRDSGKILINGKEANITDVVSARSYGISIIHQELMLAPHRSIAENIFLGHGITNKFGLVDFGKMEKKAQEMLDGFNLSLRATDEINQLSIAQRQMVEIVRAISFGAKIIVMDEPTSSLSDKETNVLFDAIFRLKKNGVGIIYISHRMSELDIVADRVTVLRDGHYIDTLEMKNTNHDQLVSLMVGRSMETYYVKHPHFSEKVLLEVEHLKSGSMVKDASFSLRQGEVLGFAGLIGSGRSELMKCLFGLAKVDSGKILLDGKPVTMRNVREAIQMGFGMVPEDRNLEGIFPKQSILYNTTIEVMDQFLRYGVYNAEKEYELAKKYLDDVLATRYSSIEQAVASLSGGNIQKVIFSRWLLSTKRILILDEPTRGIDVKTKTEIYHLIDNLTKQGLTIMLVSSELPELINMSDRIVVMSHGYTTGILEKEEFSQERIMMYATMEM
jgi:ABC-type sugar transport system ATPase subunit